MFMDHNSGASVYIYNVRYSDIGNWYIPYFFISYARILFYVFTVFTKSNPKIYLAKPGKSFHI